MTEQRMYADQNIDGKVFVEDGDYETPSYSFGSDDSSGFSLGYTLDATPARALIASILQNRVVTISEDAVQVTGRLEVSSTGSFSDTVYVGNGSAADPAIAPSGDTDTGIYFGVGDILLSVGGSLKVNLDTNSVNLAEGYNIEAGTTTGSKIGTSATQKLGFWNASPVVQDTGWSITGGYTPDKAIDPEIITLTELARSHGTLVDALKVYGILGA